MLESGQADLLLRAVPVFFLPDRIVTGYIIYGLGSRTKKPPLLQLPSPWASPEKR
jgi:hypothetical protein